MSNSETSKKTKKKPGMESLSFDILFRRLGFAKYISLHAGKWMVMMAMIHFSPGCPCKAFGLAGLGLGLGGGAQDGDG